MIYYSLKAKLHLACVTGANKNYDGSLEIDSDLMDLAGIFEYEQLHIYNNTNGNRYITYAMRGKPGSFEINAHGAGAHLVAPGDRIIICTYQSILPEETNLFKPTIVQLDEQNRVLPS